MAAALAHLFHGLCRAVRFPLRAGVVGEPLSLRPPRRRGGGVKVSTLFVNAALFQVAWLAGVLGAAQGKPWLGPLAALVVVAWHLARAPRAAPEALLLAVALIVGAAFESLLVAAGWLRFDAGTLVAGTAP